jgi:hypothetical protein
VRERLFGVSREILGGERGHESPLESKIVETLRERERSEGLWVFKEVCVWGGRRDKGREKVLERCEGETFWSLKRDFRGRKRA